MRALPRALRACATVAVVHAVLWAVVTPPFQTPDELGHVGYAQYLAETGKLPTASKVGTSGEIGFTGTLLPHGIESRPTWSRAQAHRLFEGLDSGTLSRSHPGEAGSLVNYPPLYYAVEAIPYRAGYGLDFLDRLFLMRLFSALLAGLTVAFVFLFLRELLPGTPWVWTVGALAVAFQPVFGFMSGGVNNDDLLYTCGAGLFFLIARAFRRGLTPGLGVAIGLVAVAGVLTKQSMAGLFPGAALGLAWLAWRTPREGRRTATLSAAAAGAIVVVPALFWAYASRHIVGRPPTSIVGGLTSQDVNTVSTLSGQIGYLWQVVLPPLPSMNDQIDHWIPWWVWTRGFIGIFGWFEFSFQEWVYYLGAVILGLVAALAGVEMWRRRDALRARWAELATYALMAGGLLLVIEVAAYRYFASSHQYFEQARYLFPLLALYAGIVALGARGAGRRWGPAVSGFLVVLFMGHSLFSMFQVIARYYA
jgi:4-amino-4-deoxy-L-arabinose transferase-like glycosyltransferase